MKHNALYTRDLQIPYGMVQAGMPASRPVGSELFCFAVDLLDRKDEEPP